MKQRIMIESLPCPEIKIYHTTAELSESPDETFLRPISESSARYNNVEKSLLEVGEVGLAIVTTALRIPGVRRIDIGPYKLEVTKAPAFKWREIEPQILELIARKAFESKPSKIIVSKMRSRK